MNGLMGGYPSLRCHALPYNSQAKGIIERFLTARSGTRLPEAADLSRRRDGQEAAKAAIRRRGPTSRNSAALAASRLGRLPGDVRRCHIAKYNIRPHDGLPRYRDPNTGTYRHYSPDEFWALHVRDGFEPVWSMPKSGMISSGLTKNARSVAASSSGTPTSIPSALEAYHGVWVAVGYDFAQGALFGCGSSTARRVSRAA